MDNKTLLIGALLTTGLVVAIKKGAFSPKSVTPTDVKDAQAVQMELDALKAIAIKNTASANSLQNPNSLKSKIAAIQKSIGVSVDGIAGPQTFNKLKSLFPLLTSLSNANIERIYNFVFSNPYTTPNAANVKLDYGTSLKPSTAPMVVPAKTGTNAFTSIFKPFN